MKRLLLSFSFIIMAILLTGCISIPIGDSTLEISTDGIDFVSSDDGGKEGDLTVDDGEADDTPEENGEGTYESEKVDDSADATADTSGSSGNCDNDYSELLNELPFELPMPDCAEITNISISQNTVDSYYVVEGNWKDIFEFYKEKMGDSLTDQNQDISHEWGDIRGEVTEGRYEIRAEQKEDQVSVRVWFNKD